MAIRRDASGRTVPVHVAFVEALEEEYKSNCGKTREQLLADRVGMLIGQLFFQGHISVDMVDALCFHRYRVGQ